MQEIFLGEYIKNRRLELGLTQEQLCEGICEPITLSRLENGKQTPSRNRINALLQRLGLPDDRYFALLSKNEMEINALQEEIRMDTIRYQRAGDEERPKIRETALEKIAKLEAIAEKDDRITQQYILSCTASIGKPDGPYTQAEARDILLQALRMTVPRFDLEEINSSLYSLGETQLINQIAITYSIGGERKKAIDIYRQLLKYVQKHYKELSRYAGRLSLVAHNYARELLLEKRYDEALEMAELGRRTCVEYGHYQTLPGLLDLIGGCYYFTGDLEKCKEYYLCAYFLYKSTGDVHNRLLLEKIAEERIDLDFSF